MEIEEQGLVDECQPSIWKAEGRRTFVVRGQGEIARIRFPNPLGTLAEVEACGKRYSLERAGFTHPRVMARRQGDDFDKAVLYLDPLGRTGTFVFKDGPRLSLEITDRRRGERRVVRTDGSEVMSMTDGSGLLTRGEVRFDSAWAGDETGLMASMIIYAIVLSQEDAAVRAAAGL
jgi:hypothetical protein